ncbi:hypothetical protein PDL71_01985 [Lacibacter sp. MH-610]|uniref:hypothetical protein n=1 Tax=Lacibacter sp. MH-610 TaxID=3020883 RepID=UPI0038912A65
MKQYSPCIISKVKVALDLDNKYRGNTKTCSDKYWQEVVNRLAKEKNITDTKRINRAIKRKDLYKR